MRTDDRTNLISEPKNSFVHSLDIFCKTNSEAGLANELFGLDALLAG